LSSKNLYNPGRQKNKSIRIALAGAALLMSMGSPEYCDREEFDAFIESIHYEATCNSTLLEELI